MMSREKYEAAAERLKGLGIGNVQEHQLNRPAERGGAAFRVAELSVAATFAEEAETVAKLLPSAQEFGLSLSVHHGETMAYLTLSAFGVPAEEKAEVVP